jgi:ribonuclease Z
VDTRLCDAVYALAENADLLVIEATFLAEDTTLATEYGHVTAAHAAWVAAVCGVRRLVLTHFSRRYDARARCHGEAAEIFTGDIVVAEDLAGISVPKADSRIWTCRPPDWRASRGLARGPGEGRTILKPRQVC